MQLHVDLHEVLDTYHFSQLANKELDRANRYGYCLSVATISLIRPKLIPCVETVDSIHQMGDHLRKQFRSDDVIGWDAGAKCWHAILPFCHATEAVSIELRIDESLDQLRINGVRPSVELSLIEMDAKHFHIGHMIPSIEGTRAKQTEAMLRNQARH